MITYRDRTFCVSPNCTGKCGRQLTAEIEEGAKKANLPLSLGYFCGGAPKVDALPMTDAEYRKKNKRRGDLIEKMHAGFTEEESARRFPDHPGWEAEVDRRCAANLTPDEHAELAMLTEECRAYIDAKFPRQPLAPEIQELLDRYGKKEP